MAFTILANVGETIPLYHRLEDGATTKFVRALIHDDIGGAPIATAALPHVSDGLYRGWWIVPSAKKFSVSLIVYDDAGFTTKSLRVGEDIDIVIANAGNQSALLVSIPILERPPSGSFPYKILALFQGPEGTLADPDGEVILHAVENQGGADKSANLDSTTMTRISEGRYESVYTVDSTAQIEQLVFTFSFTVNGASMTKVETASVLDTTAGGDEIKASGLNPLRSP